MANQTSNARPQSAAEQHVVKPVARYDGLDRFIAAYDVDGDYTKWAKLSFHDGNPWCQNIGGSVRGPNARHPASNETLRGEGSWLEVTCFPISYRLEFESWSQMPANVSADDAHRDSGRECAPAACEHAGDRAVPFRPKQRGNADGAHHANGRVYVPAARGRAGDCVVP